MANEAISFAEHTCWKDEDFRHVRKPVMFRLFHVGKHLGQAFDVEFEADYGIWYQQDDDLLIWYLQQAHPHVDWPSLIYHRRWDHTGIDICEPEDDRLVARMVVRQYQGSLEDVVAADLGANVVRFDDWRAAKMSSMEADSTELLLTEAIPNE
jgi:hypothetical protein